jgi:uncharacterized membrane protein
MQTGPTAPGAGSAPGPAGPTPGGPSIALIDGSVVETGADQATSPAQDHGARARMSRWLPWLLLATSVAIFSVVSFDVSWASYANITPGGIGGSTDLSIMMQALTSTGHGYVPFYESPDCVHTGRCSLFLIHPAIALYGLVPVYALDPTPALLFGLQSAAVALAAIPLFLLARDLSGSRWKGLIAAAVYLVFLPTISAIDFSFHVEPFLPLELFTLFWLWRDQHYWIGTVVAVLAVITFDVNSVLIFFFGVFFLWPFFLPAVRRFLTPLLNPGRDGGPVATLRSQLDHFFRAPWARPARAAIGLMILAVVGYIALRLFVENSTAFGFPALPARYLLPVGRPNPQFNFALVFGGSASNWFLYWIFVFALLGFVGLLVPRTLWLALPWVAYTALATSPNYTILGLHYGAIASVPLMIGFAYGLAKLPLGRPPTSLPAAKRAGFRYRRAAAWGVVAFVLAINVALTPIGPLAAPLADSTLPVYAQYPSNLTASAAVEPLQDLGRVVPQKSTLLAPYQLLPFVANDIYAYPYPPGSTKNLPFPVAALPAYVLTDPVDLSSLPPNVLAALSNANDYRARAVVPVTPIGMVTLYQAGYGGSTQMFGSAGPASWSFSPTQIKPGGNGTGIVKVAGTPYGSAVQSKLGAVAGNLLFGSPSPGLNGGSYTATVDLWVKQLNGSSGVSPKFLRLTILGASGASLASTNLSYATVPAGEWFASTLTFALSEPTYGVSVEGVLTTSHSQFQVECAAVNLQS